ncbi:ABC transporter substrate-binding protein [Hydrogenispora ethanolica]|nr:ABC transporter substrate-binding protein [Hydrogenispora ethanolica]
MRRECLRKLMVRIFSGLLLLGAALCAGPAGADGPERLPLRYSHGFAVTYLADGFKRVRDGAGRTLILAPRGRQVPAALRRYPVIPVPLRRAVFASPTQVCLLRPFQDPALWRSLAGVTSPSEEWYLDPVKEGLKAGTIAYLGDSYNPDYERLRALRPEVVFVYGGPYGQERLMKNLKTMGIPYAVDNDYLEADVLGRMEWLKFLAVFYDKERAAAAYFDAAAARAEATAARVRSGPRVKVLWGLLYDGKAYLPAADSYVARMIGMAGGEYLGPKTAGTGGGNIGVSLEEFYYLAGQADLLVSATFPSATPTLAAWLRNAPVLQTVPAVRAGRVWCLQPWYNQWLDRSDELVADLAALTHPGHFRNQRVRHFYRLP